MPISVESKKFSIRTVLRIRIPTGEGSEGSGKCMPSLEMHGRNDAVVSTTAVAGATAFADFVGASAPADAPADLAGADVPAVAGIKFSAVDEVHSSAVDYEGVPLVICTS